MVYAWYNPNIFLRQIEEMPQNEIQTEHLSSQARALVVHLCWWVSQYRGTAGVN
jgi:hypothetical protein